LADAILPITQTELAEKVSVSEFAIWSIENKKRRILARP
jgi:DNA-binding XRE family transcriptional regulator